MISTRFEGKSSAATYACVQTLIEMCRNKTIGKYVVPIVPERIATFGMEGMGSHHSASTPMRVHFTEPSFDSTGIIQKYKEAQNWSRSLEEGNSLECGAMSSFLCSRHQRIAVTA